MRLAGYDPCDDPPSTGASRVRSKQFLAGAGNQANTRANIFLDGNMIGK